MSSVCPPSNGDCACFSAAGCAGDELAAFVQLGPVVKGTARGWGPVVVSVSVVVGVKEGRRRRSSVGATCPVSNKQPVAAAHAEGIGRGVCAAGPAG